MSVAGGVMPEGDGIAMAELMGSVGFKQVLPSAFLQFQMLDHALGRPTSITQAT